MEDMQLKPGSRWTSAVCDAQVIVIRPPAQDVVLACGGAPMAAVGEAAGAETRLTAAADGAATIGKRYVDEPTGIELLCSKGGLGALTIDGRPVTLKEPKKLPASD
jgi:hypothetical protein